MLKKWYPPEFWVWSGVWGIFQKKYWSSLLVSHIPKISLISNPSPSPPSLKSYYIYTRQDVMLGGMIFSVSPKRMPRIRLWQLSLRLNCVPFTFKLTRHERILPICNLLLIICYHKNKLTSCSYFSEATKLAWQVMDSIEIPATTCVLGGDKHSKQRNISLHNAHNLIVTACYFLDIVMWILGLFVGDIFYSFRSKWPRHY